MDLKKIIEKVDYVVTSIDSYKDFILRLSPSAKITVIPIASNVDIEPASEDFHQLINALLPMWFSQEW